MEIKIYYISSSSSMNLKYTSSGTYIRDSNPLGPFKDGDKIILKDLNIILSAGVIENENSTDNNKYSTLELTPYVPPLEPKIPVFPGNYGFLGIAKNGYLYGWSYMHTTGRMVVGSKDENGDWTNSTQNRLTDISQCSHWLE